MKTSDYRRPRYFLKSACLLAAVLGLQSARAQFTFPVYEPFSEYTQGDRLRVAADTTAFWNIGNSGSTVNSPIVSTNYALSYPGLLPDPAALPMGILGPQAAGRTQGATFTSQTSGTNYLSFLFNVVSLPSADRPIIGLNAANSGTPSPNSGPSIWITPSGQLKLDKSSSTAAQTNTTPALTIGSTYLVVMSYNFNGASTNQVNLWVNPTALGNNANIPAPTIFITNSVASVASLQSLCLYSGTGIAVSTNLFDEIRVTTNWASATPASPSPGNVYNVTGGGSGCPGDAFAVGLSGSDSSSVVYLLYTNGAFSGSIVSGNNSAVTFGPQSVTANYTVLASNSVSGNVGWMNGNVNVSVLAGPVITTQPTSALAATNGLATFSVVASGSGLHYQWYKNNSGLTDGGDVLGSATATLTISPAKTADAASVATGYYVIITNSCGLSATSAPKVSLTLDAPANLVWQGGSPTTNWDLATSASWTNSAGNPAVFNSGDKVTFDDTSLNQLVTVVGSVAPTSVTENSGLSYFITGSGSIAGTGSLQMTGAGSLTISNANSFSGGSTLSSGTVTDQSVTQTGLGSGTVTLAGGTLIMGVKSGSAAVGLSNVNVTASSTLQFNGAGSYAQVILGSLTGSPGATLTMQGYLNNSATPDRVRLYGPFTNNAALVIAGAGDEVEIAPYLTTDNEVFNGIISGTYGRFVPRGGGNVIFNNAGNTFNDTSVNANNSFTAGSGYSVLLSSGNVGVGADSVVSGGNVVSSPLGTGFLGIQVGAEGGTDDLFASGGAHTLANQVVYTSTTNTETLVFGGTNNLTLTGEFSLSGSQLPSSADTFGTNRTLEVTNTLTTLAGVVDDATLGSGIIKTGNGALALNNSANTYTGPTIVSNGMLEGIGTLVSPVTVAPGGTLGAGTSGIGKLTINSSLTLLGNIFAKVNLATSPSNDVIAVSGALANSGTGTVTVTNIGATALAVGNKFYLFNKALTGGSTLSVTGGGANWNNNLATDGSIQVQSLNSGTASYSTNITASVSGSTLTISWPTTHLGWILQSQTNALNTGLTVPTNSWHDISGSATVTQEPININAANPTVFFRLRHP
jgi:autotransporter-associated beta strand protein